MSRSPRLIPFLGGCCRAGVRLSFWGVALYLSVGFFSSRLLPDPGVSLTPPATAGIEPGSAPSLAGSTSLGATASSSVLSVRVGPDAAPLSSTAERWEVLGAFSVHTGLSHDAEGSREQVSKAAASAGLDFVFLGDHPGDWVEAGGSPTDWSRGVLVVGGQELSVNSVGRVLAVGLDTLPRRWESGLGSLAERLERTGGFAAVVHPRSPLSRERWTGLETGGIPAWEVFDVSEMARRRQRDHWVGYHLLALLGGIVTHAGEEQLLRLNREGFEAPAIAAYDSARAHGPLTATGALNHHPKAQWRGILFPRYEPFFRTVVNHVVLDAPLPGDPDEATRRITDAVRAGRLHISLGAADEARGFEIEAVSGDRTAPAGGRLGWAGRGEVRVRVPGDRRDRRYLRLIRDGVPVSGVRARGGEQAVWAVAEPGIYRVEVFTLGIDLGPWVWNLRPWIFSNPVEFIRDLSEGPEVGGR